MDSESRNTLFARYRLPLAILSVIGVAVILLATQNYGAGLSSDSVMYISTARNIANGSGAVGYDQTPLVVFAPLYPALLALIDYVFGVDPVSSARIVNAILFGLIVYLSGILFLKHLKAFVAFALFGAASVPVAFPLIQVSLMAWSEPLFICFVLLYLILFDLYLSKGDTCWLLLLSLSVAFACLTRYLGVVLILTGVASIVLLGRHSPMVKFRHLCLFIAISAFPIGMWLTRNYFLSGTLFGPRAPSIYTLSQNVAFTLHTFLTWYAPLILLLCVLILFLYIPKMVSTHRSFVIPLRSAIGVLVSFFTSRRKWSKVESVALEISPMVLFVVAHVGFLLISSTTTAYDRIDDRLLSPVFVPLTLLLLLLASGIPTLLTEQRLSQKRIEILLTIVTAVWLVFLAGVTMLNAGVTSKQGRAFSSQSWKNSQTIRYVLHSGIPDGVIYTNAPDALYLLANITGKRSPNKTMYNSPKIVNTLSSLKGVWPEEGKAYLVWLQAFDRKHLFTPDELKTIADVQQIVRLEDGAIYRVTRK